uniref:Uncharacterized protein n=1 Tax=Cyanistes caeruleus TaxID=156563 RepID=A0A8C0UEL1_CYACU
MAFATGLRVVGDESRRKYLQSTDEAERTQYKEDWTQMKVKMGTALGEDVPSLQGAAKIMHTTDAVEEATELLKKLLPEMVRFEASLEELELSKDGGS